MLVHHYSKSSKKKKHVLKVIKFKQRSSQVSYHVMYPGDTRYENRIKNFCYKTCQHFFKKKILSKNYDHVGTTCDTDLESSHLGERNLIFIFTDPPILIKN